MRSQENHIFASIVAFFKLEVMKQKTTMSHYAMKSIIHLEAIKSAWNKLDELKATNQLSFNFA
jgi:hypothetical protein